MKPEASCFTFHFVRYEDCPPAAQQKAIADRLEQVTGKKVELRLHEDKSLIGGVVVKIGDRRIDGSVAGRLEMMKRKLLANE